MTWHKNITKGFFLGLKFPRNNAVAAAAPRVWLHPGNKVTMQRQRDWGEQWCLSPTQAKFRLWLWVSGCGTSQWDCAALSPAAASFQDHNLDLKTSRTDKLEQGTLLRRLLALEREEEGYIQIKLSSTEGNCFLKESHLIIEVKALINVWLVHDQCLWK